MLKAWARWVLKEELQALLRRHAELTAQLEACQTSALCEAGREKTDSEMPEDLNKHAQELQIELQKMQAEGQSQQVLAEYKQATLQAELERSKALCASLESQIEDLTVAYENRIKDLTWQNDKLMRALEKEA